MRRWNSRSRLLEPGLEHAQLGSVAKRPLDRSRRGHPAANGGNGPTVGNGNNDIDFKAPSVFQGVIYTVNSCHIHGAGAYLSGPIICGLIDTAGLGGLRHAVSAGATVEGGGTTTTTVTPGTTTVTSTPGTTTVFATTPGSQRPRASAPARSVTGTTLGLDE